MMNRVSIYETSTSMYVITFSQDVLHTLDPGLCWWRLRLVQHLLPGQLCHGHGLGPHAEPWPGQYPSFWGAFRTFFILDQVRFKRPIPTLLRGRVLHNYGHKCEHWGENNGVVIKGSYALRVLIFNDDFDKILFQCIPLYAHTTHLNILKGPLEWAPLFLFPPSILWDGGDSDLGKAAFTLLMYTEHWVLSIIGKVEVTSHLSSAPHEQQAASFDTTVNWFEAKFN